MALDGRNLQVLANFCAAAADAMAFTLMRTAHSAFVKETEDFSCQIVTREGLAFANPRRFGAPWYSGIDYAPLIGAFESYAPGDVCITNDPYSGFVATHSPDMHIWKPVFHEGRLACFVVGHIHNTDVGGAVPASLSRSLTEIVQEGVRIPPVRLVRDGVIDPLVLAMLAANVRMPEQNLGDLHAQIASVAIGERRMQEIIARFGFESFIEGAAQILDYAEAQARAVLRHVPDGDYDFADYADEDQPGGYPCRIALTLRIRGDAAELDYSGSDPQLASSLNMPTGGHPRHPLALVGLIYVLSTLKPGLLLNAGTLRAARAVLPEGSVVNCTAPAAVGMRSLTCAMTQIVTIGAFARALPDRIPVSAPGGNAIMNVKTSDRQGRPIMASIGPVGGGGGGGPAQDGSNGAGGISGFLRNTPIELTEAEVSILFRRYGLATDSAGPGRWRAGLSAIMEFAVTAPGTVVTARNRNRSVMSSWGLAGGAPGRLSRFTRSPAGIGAEEELGNTDVLACGPGDVVRVIGPGAGGHGDAYARPPALVLRDVRRGFVSVDAAAQDYGVVIRQGSVDDVATAALRAAPRPVPEAITFGPERRAFESVWTSARYALLTSFLASLPVTWRFFVKHQVFASVAAGEGGEGEALGEEMAALFARLRTRYAL